MTGHAARIDACIDGSVEATTGAPCQNRMATALEWLADGKPRNWKYLSC